LRNYDPLVREVNAMYGSLARLRETVVIDAETAAAVDQLAVSVHQQEDLVEQFKTVNALLQNSLSLFGRFSVRLAASPQNGTLGAAVSAAAAAMLHLTLDTSSAAAREVQDRLDELASQPIPSGDSDSVRALLAQCPRCRESGTWQRCTRWCWRARAHQGQRHVSFAGCSTRRR
jgi:hypothetical protein